MFIIKLLLLIVSDMLVRQKIIANILKFALLNGKVTIFCMLRISSVIIWHLLT